MNHGSSGVKAEEPRKGPNAVITEKDGSAPMTLIYQLAPLVVYDWAGFGI